MIRPLRVALVSAALLVATFGLSVLSCKSNDIGITNNNSTEYQSSVSQKVDPATDTTVDGPDGSQAHFPAGALAETTTITIGKMKDGNYPNLPSGWVATGSVYSFEPHTSVFTKAVDIKVPYTVSSAGVRLVVSEPGGSWTPVDGAALAGGFGTTQTPHFSFYTVVTGAPPDPTIADAGVDATVNPPQDAGTDSTIADTGIDVVIEAAVDAGPPLPPTLFSLLLTSSSISREFLADAGDEAGAFDGGLFSLPSGQAIAYGAGKIFGLQLFAGGDGGALTPFSDPFDAMTPQTAALLPNLSQPGALVFYKNELWVSDNQTISTYDTTGQPTWSLSLADAGDTLHEFAIFNDTLYVITNSTTQLRLYTIGGTGAGKTLTPLGSQILLTNDGGFTYVARAIVITPWNELLLADNTTVHRLDLAGNETGIYSATINANQILSFCATRVNGIDGLIVADGETGNLATYTFLPSDTTHATPIKGPSLPIGAATQVLVAP